VKIVCAILGYNTWLVFLGGLLGLFRRWWWSIELRQAVLLADIRKSVRMCVYSKETFFRTLFLLNFSMGRLAKLLDGKYLKAEIQLLKSVMQRLRLFAEAQRSRPVQYTFNGGKSANF